MGENYDALRRQLARKKKQVSAAMLALAIAFVLIGIFQMILGSWISVATNWLVVGMILLWRRTLRLYETVLEQVDDRANWNRRSMQLRAADASLMLSLGEVGAAREILNEMCTGLVADD